MAGPLDDLRIILIGSGAAAEVATMVLADFGADVIKAEPPGGDPIREHRAAPMWLRGKRSVVLDLETADGQKALQRLATGADVVVSAFAPGEAERLSLGYEDLRRLNPRLVYCAITGWGPRGPYAQYPADEELVAAKSGRMLGLAGVDPREGPSFEALLVGTHAAAQSAISGILAAIAVRERSGIGQLVETSLLRGMIPYDFRNMLFDQLHQKFPERAMKELGPPGSAAGMLPMLGYQPIMGADGRWIQFANLMPHLFEATVVAMGLEEQILNDPRYLKGQPNALGPEVREDVRNALLLRAKEKPAAEWMEIFRGNGDVAGDISGTAQSALDHPDLVANGEVIEITDPELGPVRQMGALAMFSGTPPEITRPAPRIGEHTKEVLGEPARTLATPHVSATDKRAPLAGITVLEFATMVAAPLGGALLGDLGARVIKVEPINGGDPFRLMAGPGLGRYIMSAKPTASKESLSIDLKAPESREIVRELVSRADILLHNYRIGVPERLGIGYEQVKAIKPDLIWMHVSGYGPKGPNNSRPAAHPIPGAVNGGATWQAGKGWPQSDTSTLDGLREAARRFYKANEGNPDPNTSVVVPAAAMIALHARRRTGQGQAIYLSMLGANAFANSDDALSYAGKPPRPELDAHVFGIGALQRLYPAASGTWVYVDAATDEAWMKLCAALDRSGLCADPRFATVAARADNADALAALLEPAFAARHADEWEATLMQRGIACVRADQRGDGDFFLNDPHARDNGLALDAHHKVIGDYKRWGAMVTFSDTPGRYGPGCLAGEHTDAILGELGLPADRIAALRSAGVVWSDDTPPA